MPNDRPLANTAEIRLLRSPVRPRPNLVLVRAGYDSEHLGWNLPSLTGRSWDLGILSYAGRVEAVDIPGADWLAVGGFTKWHALDRLLDAAPGMLDAYRGIWVIDDDIRIGDLTNVDVLFSVARDWRLQVSQPALSPQSHASFELTRQHPALLLHYTNYIESMMPLFDAAAFRTVRKDFGRYISGWGLDALWWHRLGQPDRGFAVIDGVTVTHTRPIDHGAGAFYRYMRSLGIDPVDDLRGALREMGLERLELSVTGFVPVRTLVRPGGPAGTSGAHEASG